MTRPTTRARRIALILLAAGALSGCGGGYYGGYYSYGYTRGATTQARACHSGGGYSSPELALITAMVYGAALLIDLCFD